MGGAVVPVKQCRQRPLGFEDGACEEQSPENERGIWSR